MYILIALLLIVIVGFFVMSKGPKLDDNKNDEMILDTSQKDLKKGGNIVHVSDIHYLASELTDYGKAFEEKVESWDAKTVRYVDRILDAFILEMIDRNPDVIVIGGDLSYNGEKISHIKLAEKLRILKDKNIEVLVIPGNHDVDYNRSLSFFGENAESVDNISSEEFVEIYSRYGLGDEKRVISRDKNSLSYMYKLSSNVNILMLDTNTNKNINEISKATLKWVEKVLRYSYERNINVISVTHQNILAHNKMFASGYKISNSINLIEIFKKYNVRLNVSGHMHLQHLAEYKDVIDASVGSIGLYPNIFANIIIGEKNSIDYHTEKLDVEKWMKKYKVEDENLLNYSEYAIKNFRRVSDQQAEKAFKDAEISEEDKDIMREFLGESSRIYFSGELYKHPELSRENPAYKMWVEYLPKTLQTSYLDSIYSDSVGKNHNEIKISK